MNPFLVAMALMNVGAATWYFSHHRPLLGGLMLCYAASSAILARL